jgi:hypothetical protein
VPKNKKDRTKRNLFLKKNKIPKVSILKIEMEAKRGGTCL